MKAAKMFFFVLVSCFLFVSLAYAGSEWVPEVISKKQLCKTSPAIVVYVPEINDYEFVCVTEKELQGFNDFCKGNFWNETGAEVIKKIDDKVQKRVKMKYREEERKKKYEI